MRAKGVPISATARAERSREVTKAALARELWYAAILARLWPAYIANDSRENPSFPHVLCVDSPAGLLTWRMSADELDLFEFLDVPRKNLPIAPRDRQPVLMALAANGWTK